MKKAILVVTGIALAVAFGPAVAEADVCRHNCAIESGCSGGCEISDTSTCACAAWGGPCDYKCQLIGPGCSGNNIEGMCPQEPPPTSASSHGLVEWAILQIWSEDGLNPAGPESIHALAASSAVFSSRIESEYWDRASETRGSSSLVPKRKPERSQGAPLQQRMVLYLQPNVACSDFSSRLETSTFPGVAEIGTQAYFRGVTDSMGRLKTVEILYSNYPERNPDLVRFLRDNLRAWSLERSDSSLSLYGGLTILGDNEVSYSVGAVTTPPA